MTAMETTVMTVIAKTMATVATLSTTLAAREWAGDFGACSVIDPLSFRPTYWAAGSSRKRPKPKPNGLETIESKDASLREAAGCEVRQVG